MPNSKDVYSGYSDGWGFAGGVFYRVNPAGPGAQTRSMSGDPRGW